MEHLIIIWLSDILPMSVPDEGYSMEHLIIIWLSDILPMMKVIPETCHVH